LNSESRHFPSADTLEWVEGNTKQVAIGKTCVDLAESKTQSMDGNFKHENREIPRVCGRKSSAAVRKLHRR